MRAPQPVSPARPAWRNETFKMVLAFAVIYLVWGSTYLAIRYAVETIPPLTVAGVRQLLAGGVLLALAWARGYRPQREHWLSGAILGALFFFIGHGSLHWAEQRVPSGLAALLVATEPLFILLLAWIMGRQRVTWASLSGLALGAGGVACLGLSGTGADPVGLFAVLVGAISWSVGVVISPRLSLPSETLARTAVPLLCGAAMLLTTAGAIGEWQAFQWSRVSLKSALGLVYLVLFGSILALTAFTWLLQRCSPAVVATHTYANPVVAILLGWLLASEPFSSRVGLASLAILGAIVLIRRGERAAESAPVAPPSAEAESPA